MCSETIRTRGRFVTIPHQANAARAVSLLLGVLLLAAPLSAPRASALRDDPGPSGAAADALGSPPAEPVAVNGPRLAQSETDPVDQTLAPSPAEAAADALVDGSAGTTSDPPTEGWLVDQDKSRVTFTFDFGKEPVTVEIGSWRANIAFDPENLADSSVAVIFDMSSVAPSKSQVSPARLQGEEGFAIDTFGDAEFETTTIEAKGEDRYQANGTLTIKGTSRPVSLPFTLEVAEGVGRAKGTLKVDPVDYDVGVGKNSAESWLGREVTISVDVTAAAPQQ